MSSGFQLGPGQPRPGPTMFAATSRPAQVARLVAGSLQALGPAAPTALTSNQYWVSLVRTVTVQFKALPM